MGDHVINSSQGKGSENSIVYICLYLYRQIRRVEGEKVGREKSEFKKKGLFFLKKEIIQRVDNIRIFAHTNSSKYIGK